MRPVAGLVAPASEVAVVPICALNHTETILAEICEQWPVPLRLGSAQRQGQGLVRDQGSSDRICLQVNPEQINRDRQD
jgi:hypothetical protein